MYCSSNLRFLFLLRGTFLYDTYVCTLRMVHSSMPRGLFHGDLFEEICLILTKREFRMGECSILKGRAVAGEGNAPLSMTNKILICYAVIQ